MWLRGSNRQDQEYTVWAQQDTPRALGEFETGQADWALNSLRGSRAFLLTSKSRTEHLLDGDIQQLDASFPRKLWDQAPHRAAPRRPLKRRI